MAEAKFLSTQGSGREESVSWETDRANPYNWPKGQKYLTTLLLSASSFNTIATSSIVAPALPQISEELSISSALTTQLVLSIYVLAYAVGNTLWAPLSECYGRKTVLQLANLWFCVWNLVCGFAQNEATLTVGRLFSGVGAAATLALGFGTLGEIWKPEQRGRSLAVLSTITLLGPCLGPIIGGLVADRYVGSWRWAFWATTLSNVLIQLLSVPFYHESHAPSILQKRKMNGKSVKENFTSFSLAGKIILTAMERPFYLTFTQPASAGIVLYTGINFGALYFMLALIPQAFEETYNQTPFAASINYLSYGVGTIFGAQFCAPLVDAVYRRCIKTHTQQMRDEENSIEKVPNFEAPAELRLCPFIPAIIITVFGFIITGWSLQYVQHWAIPNLGIALFGFGSQTMTQSTNAYMIDSFNKIHPGQQSGRTVLNWSASAMASVWAGKSIGGFTFPLFSVQLVKSLGWGWSFSLLALIHFAVGIPVAVILLTAGERLRQRGRKKIEDDLAAGRLGT